MSFTNTALKVVMHPVLLVHILMKVTHYTLVNRVIIPA